MPRPPTAADLRALSRLKLKWQHLNPYGTFTLNMRERLSLEQLAGPARYFAGISGFGILRPHIMPDSLLQLTLCDRGELPLRNLPQFWPANRCVLERFFKHTNGSHGDWGVRSEL